jgi:hypothetical protein
VSDFFSVDHVQRDPTDIELVREVTLQQLSDWLMWHLQGLPEQYLKRIRDLDSLKDGLAPIFKEMRDGDTIWLGESQYREPLYGHEGVALVRGERPIVYIRVLNH